MFVVVVVRETPKPPARRPSMFEMRRWSSSRVSVGLVCWDDDEVANPEAWVVWGSS